MATQYSETLRLAVIEGKWAEKFGGLPRNISVKPVFDFLSDMLRCNQHAYHYEMVSDLASLRCAVQRICEDREIKIIYIGTHGTRTTIEFINESIHYKAFADMLIEELHLRNKHVDGLYLGSCLIGNKKVAKHILENTSHIKWIAGYSEEIDFTISTCFDLMFFRYYYYFYNNTAASAVDAMGYMEPFLMNLYGLTNTETENRNHTKLLCGKTNNFNHRDIFPYQVGLGFRIFKSENGEIIDSLREF